MKKSFNPLVFLASLGAGGIAVGPFVYFQYILEHPKGLVTLPQLLEIGEKTGNTAIFGVMMAVMVIFGLLHFALTFKFLADFFKWKKTSDYKEYIGDPQRNTSILALFTSIAMTFNVFIGVIRFFTPLFYNNFQALMLPALIAWGILWLAVMQTEIKLLKTAFEKEFDVDKISFGWLLHPFALGMLTVAGTGIAALAKDPSISHTAAFLSMTSGGMGFFLFLVKLFSIFKSHFQMKGLPERQFLPSFLIVIPITTIYAISAFRFGHYMEKQFLFHLDWYFTLAILIPFAFQTWYFAFGLTMLKSYFKRDFFKKEYYVTLWAFICPFVGYAVLGSFLYQTFVPSTIIQGVIVASLLLAITFYVFVSARYIKYRK